MKMGPDPFPPMSCQSLRWLCHGEAKFSQLNLLLLEHLPKKDIQTLIGEYKANPRFRNREKWRLGQWPYSWC
jgi:hypothetical protein